VTKRLIAKDTDFYEQGTLNSVPRCGELLSCGGNYEGIRWTGQHSSTIKWTGQQYNQMDWTAAQLDGLDSSTIRWTGQQYN